MKHECDIKKYYLKGKIWTTANKLSGKNCGRDVELNEELIKICLETVEKHLAAIQEGKFHLSMLEDRETKVFRYCNFNANCMQENPQYGTLIKPFFTYINSNLRRGKFNWDKNILLKLFY
jgi:hypothetical protein